MRRKPNIALRAARSAGNLIRRAAESSDPVSVTKKGMNDFVTEVDRAAEKRIIETLPKAYPDHGILAEESGIIEGRAKGPIISGSSTRWMAPPTLSMASPSTVFPLPSSTKAKWNMRFYDPNRDEEFTASRGRGAALNGRRIRCTNRPGLDGCLIGTGFPFRKDQAPFMDAYLGMFADIAASTAACAAGLCRPGPGLAGRRPPGWFL